MSRYADWRDAVPLIPQFGGEEPLCVFVWDKLMFISDITAI